MAVLCPLRRCVADRAPQELGEEHALTLANFAKAIVKRLENMSLGTKRKVTMQHCPWCRPCVHARCMPLLQAGAALYSTSVPKRGNQR
jgi:hypothetical protein